MTTAEQTPEDGTTAPAVGIPLDRRVRPLVTQLRAAAGEPAYNLDHRLMDLAADEIERLREALYRLRAWGGRPMTDGDYHGTVVVDVRAWIDGGMCGELPELPPIARMWPNVALSGAPSDADEASRL